MQPVKMCWNAFSTFDESSADVSIKDKLFFSTTITDATITLGAGTTATGNTWAAARVQNSAARLINDVPYHEQITPCLWELHWPPVQLTECKLCLMTLNVHNARYPPLYLSHMMQSAERSSLLFRLRSADLASSVKPRNLENGRYHSPFQQRGISPAILRNIADSYRRYRLLSENWK